MYNVLDSIIISLLHFQKYVFVKAKVYVNSFVRKSVKHGISIQTNSLSTSSYGFHSCYQLVKKEIVNIACCSGIKKIHQ